MIRLATPTAGPEWLPPYTRSIERYLQSALAEPGVSSVTGGFSVTELSGERIFLIEASGFRGVLPSASGNAAKLTFKLMVAGSFTLAAKAGETIDGATSATLATQYEAVTLFSNGSDWVVLMAYQPMSGVADALTALGGHLQQINGAERASVYLLSQIAALSRGRADPMPSEESEKLIAEYTI